MKSIGQYNKRGETTRRDFLKYSAAAAASVSAGSGCVRNVHVAGSDIIRVGMIGCGGRCAGAAAEALTADPGARLVAMCDIIKDRLQGNANDLRSNSRIRLPLMMTTVSWALTGINMS